MAKELPYFKFETSQWDNGTIQLCSRESKGLFIDICSMYWARLGELKTKLVVQKLCNGNASALQELIDEEIIVEDNGFINILFLEDQLVEFAEISSKRSNAAKKRWGNPTKKKANAMQVHSKSNAIREDKKREENNIPTYEVFKKYAISKKPNIDENALRLKYESWKENGWKDGNNKKIKNWKSKILNTLPYLLESKKSITNNNGLLRGQ